MISSPSDSSILLRCLQALLWICFGLVIIFIIWGINKGFDLTDEAYNMLSYTKGQEMSVKVSLFYTLLQKLCSIFSPGIIFFRVFRLVLLLISACIFSIAIVKWIPTVLKSEVLYPTFSLLFPIVGITTLMSYSIFYSALSYNSLSLFLGQLFLSFILFYLIPKDNSANIRLMDASFLFLATIIVTLLFLVKFTSGLLFLLTLVVIFAFSLQRKKFKLKIFLIEISAMLAGFLSVLVAISFLIDTPINVVKGFTNTLQYIPGHEPIGLLKMYAIDLIINFGVIIIYHPAFYLGPVLLWMSIRDPQDKAAQYTQILVLVSFMIDFLISGYYRAGTTGLYHASLPYRLILWSVIIYILLCLSLNKSREAIKAKITDIFQLILVSVLLLACPFLISFGSDSPLSVHITQNIFSWVVLFLIIYLIIFWNTRQVKVFFLGFILLVCLTASSQILYGYIKSPYRQLAPLTDCRYTIRELPRGNNIRFDAKTKDFLKASLQLLTRHNVEPAGSPILSIYNLPGLTYLLGGFTPGQPWFNSAKYAGNEKNNSWYIQQSNMKNLDKTILIIQKQYKLPYELINAMNKKGINFPSGYYLADSLQSPFDNKEIYFYFPVN